MKFRCKLCVCVVLGLLNVMAAGLPNTVPPVRADHPRLFFNSDTWSAVKAAAEGPAKPALERLLQRCDAFPDDPVCSGMEPAPEGWSRATPLSEIKEWGPQASECALAWRFTGERKYLEKAKKMLEVTIAAYNLCVKNLRAVAWEATTQIHAVCAYDWIYEGLTPEERKALALPLIQYCADVQSKPGRTIVRLNTGGATTGYYGVPALKWYAGVAMSGDGICDALAKDLLQRGYAQMVEMLDHREKTSGDDGPLSTGVVGYALNDYPWAHFNFFHTLRSACGVDAAPLYPGLGLFPNFIWWNWIRTEGAPLVFGFGDTRHSRNLLGLGNVYVHLSQYAHFFAQSDPDAARLAASLREFVPPENLASKWTVYPFLLAALEPVKPFPVKKMEKPSLRARHFESTGQFIMRSGWTPGATYAMFTAGGTLSNHRHYDENNFIIYKNGFQALDTGSRALQDDYNLDYYYVQTIAHNCVLIHKPEEPMPHSWGLKYNGPEGRFCDGGQTKMSVAKVLAFETNPLYTYIAADAAPAYPGKCSECVRQFLYVTDDCFVIYDRVTSDQADYAKEWLLHTDGEPALTGNLMEAKNFNGVIFCRTLLPEHAVGEKIGGPGKEYWSNGRNWELNPDYVKSAQRDCEKCGLGGPWFGQWRLSVKPSAPAKEDRFLHVINVANQTGAQAFVSERVKDRARDGAKVAIPGMTVKGITGTLEIVAWFNRTGKVGGELEFRLFDEAGKVRFSNKRVFTEEVHNQVGVFDRKE